MSVKLLNLDEVSVGDDRKKIVLGGRTHTASEMTVEKYIENVKRAERAEKESSAPKSAEDQINSTIDFIMDTFPTLKRSDILPLSTTQMKAIVDYIVGTPDMSASPPTNETQVTGQVGNG